MVCLLPDLPTSNNGEGEETPAVWWGNCGFTLTGGPSPKREMGKSGCKGGVGCRLARNEVAIC